MKNARGSALSVAQQCLALKNVRRMRLSASRAVPQRWDPVGLEQNFNAEAERWNLRLSVGCQISCVCFFDMFH